MSRSLTEYAIRWEPAPPYPDMSRPFLSVDEAKRALDDSAFEGEIVARTVTYSEWRKAVVAHGMGSAAGV